MNCRLCGSAQLETLYSHTRDYITGESHQVVRCLQCDGAFTILHTDDLSPYYPKRYRRYTPFILALLKRLYRIRVSQWSQGFDKPGYAFEMGCADGFMLDALRQKGWTVLGSERTDAMLTYAHQTQKIPVFAGDPEALQPHATFDLIILFQVLEHLPNPVQTLSTLGKLLKPDGKLIICVPNRASWQSYFGKDVWFHLDAPRHIFHYTPRSISTMLNSVGLTKDKITYQSFEHDPYGWVQTVLNKMDTRPNRLTRLLTGMDKPNSANLIHLIAGCLLMLFAVPVSLVSWWRGKGAIMQVIVSKRSS